MSSVSDRRRRLHLVRNGLVGVVIVLLVASLAPRSSEAASEAEPGSAGIDTSLPATDSQVTVHGRGVNSALEITVNQTRNLNSQAISLSWTGGVPTTQGSARFFENYLQVMQCWGEDDGSNADNPGPPPEQCVAGASDGVPGGNSASLFPSASEAVSRVVSKRQYGNFDQSAGTYDARTGLVWRPFRAVDGTEIGVQYDPDFNPYISGGNYWLNPYFDVVTTNELPGAQTGPDGTGQQLFQVNTGVESSGLGCGQRLIPAGGGEPRIPKCWLVIVPRGSAATENAGTGFLDNAGVITSPLAAAPWANRIAVPLEFNPVDSACDINQDDRRIVGSELAAAAVTSWQPALCATDGLPPFTYGTVADSAARQQVAAPTAGSAGMAVTSEPLSEAQGDASSPTVYAPVSLSGAVIGFNVERVPGLSAGAEEQSLSGVRVATLKLTPRLVAKLLTQSYSFQVSVNAVSPPPYSWAAKNPRQMAEDPDFLRFNPEFTLLQVRQWRNFGGLVLPARNSDLAKQLWEYVLADPEARAWLDGEPDDWGMTVNPIYATTAAANANGGAFADPVPDSFPKADPYCHQEPALANQVVPPPLCGTDWVPYVQGLSEAAVVARGGDDRAKITLNPFAVSSDQAWKRGVPQALGERAILSLTDTASAARYGLQTAQLSRAGDDGDDRSFIAADTDGLETGVAAMTPSSEPDVLVPDPAASVSGAYPLTMLTYAAVKPLELSAPARSQYAAFLEYAAADGQVPGLDPGRLPVGYAPLPDSLKAQSLDAASLIRAMQAPTTVAQTPIATDSFEGSVPSSAPFDSNREGGPASSKPAPTTIASPIETDLASGSTDVATSGNAGPLTPILALARSRYFLLVLAMTALASTVIALEITKRPRRRAIQLHEASK